MSAADDCPDDMGARTRLDDRTVEGLLAGRPVPDPDTDLADLAALIAGLRAVGDDCAPQPGAQLAHILTHGLPADAAAHDPTVTAPAAPRRSRRRPRLAYVRGVPTTTAALVAGLLAKVAGLGGVAKTALALTAATAIAAGAAATDLPQAVGDALDRGRQQAPADLPEDARFGGDVSDDAADPASPGVHGPGVADDARAKGEEPEPGSPSLPGGGTRQPAADGLDRAREETADTPARPGPGAAGERAPASPPGGPPETARTRPPGNSPGQRPDATPAPSSPPADTPGLLPAPRTPIAPPAGPAPSQPGGATTAPDPTAPAPGRAPGAPVPSQPSGATPQTHGSPSPWEGAAQK